MRIHSQALREDGLDALRRHVAVAEEVDLRRLVDDLIRRDELVGNHCRLTPIRVVDLVCHVRISSLLRLLPLPSE